MRAKGNERGIALITVLLVVTLLTIAVIEFSFNVALDAHRARNARDALQATLLARSGINLAERFLTLDEDANFDSPLEDWWIDLQEFCAGLPLGADMALKCDVEDESGKINVNLTRGVRRVVESQAVTPDVVLRDAVNCIFNNRNISSLEGQEINVRLQEYWSQDPLVNSDGREQKVPDFGSLEDFGGQFALTGDELRELRHFLTAQPGNLMRTINVNTARAEVLAAVINPDDPHAPCEANDAVNNILTQRQEAPIESQGALNTMLAGLDNVNAKRRLLTVRSSIYRLQASGIVHFDPSSPDGGGLGKTLSVLVRRKRDPRRRDPDREGPGWTLRAVDWQKEGGARLFVHPDGEDEGDLFDQFDRSDRGDESLF